MKRPFYPLLFALYPVLALLAVNINEMKPVEALRSLLVTLAGGILLFLLLKLVLRNTEKAALLFAVLWAWFFSYGQVYHYLEQTLVFGMSLGRHRLLLPVWLILLALGLWWALTRRGELANLTTAMNLVGMVLLVFPVFQIAWAEIRAQSAWSQAKQTSPDSGALQLSAGQTPPDIYYIILDAYGRQDILQDNFAYDNSAFLEQLRELGFYVARCSLSNYAQTELSLSSSLNFDYLPALMDDLDPSSTDRSGLLPLLQDSAARRMLEALGYQTVAFETGYTWIQWEDADVYLAPDGELGGLSAFEVMYIESTAGLALTDMASRLPASIVPDTNFPKQHQRNRILFALDSLGNLPDSVSGPKFVYAHIIAPHDPYVLDQNGNWVDISEPMDDATFQAGYRDELVYLNQRVLAVVKKIIQESATPPVIILQGDHGPGRASHEGRLKILNAYYLPGVSTEALYPSLTPANTFRLVFNQYFGGSFALLEDQSYYSVYDAPYQFEEIINGCDAGENQVP